jgi:hypothetical protein
MATAGGIDRLAAALYDIAHFVVDPSVPIFTIYQVECPCGQATGRSGGRSTTFVSVSVPGKGRIHLKVGSCNVDPIAEVRESKQGIGLSGRTYSNTVCVVGRIASAVASLFSAAAMITAPRLRA